MREGQAVAELPPGGGERLEDELQRAVLTHWILVGICGLLTLAVGYAIVHLETPLYDSTALLLPAKSNDRSALASLASGSLGGLASLAGVAGAGLGGQDTYESIAMLQSRGFIEDFIRSHNLLPELFPTKWDAAKGTWKGPEEKWPTLWRGYRLFSKQILSVNLDKKTGLVSVEIEWRNRVEGAAWANELVDIVNDRMRARAVKEAEDTTQYLEKQQGVVESATVRAAISAMIENQLKTKALASVRQQYAFSVIDRAEPADADQKVRPNKFPIYFGSLGLGLIIGAAIALRRDRRMRRESASPSL